MFHAKMTNIKIFPPLKNKIKQIFLKKDCPFFFFSPEVVQNVVEDILIPSFNVAFWQYGIHCGKIILLLTSASSSSPAFQISKYPNI